MSWQCFAWQLFWVPGSGEDGEQGPQGPPGIDGVDGKDGEDGADGNVNVKRFDINVSELSGSLWLLDIPIDPNELPSYTLLLYLYKFDSSVYSIPGRLGANHGAWVHYNEVLAQVGISFYNQMDGTDYDMSPGIYEWLRIIAVETPAIMKGNGKDLLSELKAAGVDTSDYHAVAAYFGLE